MTFKRSDLRPIARSFPIASAEDGVHQFESGHPWPGYVRPNNEEGLCRIPAVVPGIHKATDLVENVEYAVQLISAVRNALDIASDDVVDVFGLEQLDR